MTFLSDLRAKRKRLVAQDTPMTAEELHETIEAQILENERMPGAQDLADAERALIKHREPGEAPHCLDEFDAVLDLDAQKHC